VGVRPRREAQLQKKTLIASERDRPDVARRRAQWTRYQRRIAPSRLVFIDETWTKTNMAPLRGWAPRGQRLKAKVPHGRWCAQRMRSIKTMTFLAALRHDHVEAPWLIDGPINGERVRLYVEKVLVPTLKPHDIVILDTLGSQRGKAVRRALRSAGAKLIFLPKYSPDLNPIEMLLGMPRFARSKLKHLLRKAAERNADAVCNAIGQILDSLTAQECRNYFAQAGYD
jgi:putative transposase